MNMELRQWAIEKAIAAGTDCFAVTEIAAQVLAFVTQEPAKPTVARRRFALSDYEEAFDAGLRPREVAAKHGIKSGRVSVMYTRIRRARGIAQLRTGFAVSGRQNGAAHS